MTTIITHGILARSSGRKINLKIGKLCHLLDAIDANKPGFIKKVNKLSRMGFYYSVIVDGKIIKNLSEFKNKKNPEKIDLVPVISGSGVALIIGGLVAGGLVVTGAVVAGTLAATILTNLAVFLIGTGLSMLLAPKPEFPDTKAQESVVRGLEQSFSFANKANLAEQGISVPIGYGRLKVSSQIIQASLKNYPQNVRPTQSMTIYSNDASAPFNRSDSEITS